MAWRCGGPCPHDAVVKNVATTTSPTSSSKQSPRRSGTSTCGSSPVSGFTKLPSIAVRGVTTGSTLSPRSNARTLSYTYRFEQFVLRSLIGSTAEEVARRLGISAETVDRIVENQLTEDRQIDPQRVITDIGLDELSLKKRHRLYVTLMTDLSDPTRPQILAVERGRDTTATLKCLDRLTQETTPTGPHPSGRHGAGLSSGVVALRLPHSRAVTDRFHVAKKFNEVVDSLTQEYHSRVQGEADQGPAKSLSVPNVGLPPRSREFECRGEASVGGPL